MGTFITAVFTILLLITHPLLRNAGFISTCELISLTFLLLCKRKMGTLKQTKVFCDDQNNVNKHLLKILGSVTNYMKKQRYQIHYTILYMKSWTRFTNEITKKTLHISLLDCS